MITSHHKALLCMLNYNQKNEEKHMIKRGICEYKIKYTAKVLCKSFSMFYESMNAFENNSVLVVADRIISK